MISRPRRLVSVLWLSMLLAATGAFAQTAADVNTRIDERLRELWETLLQDAATRAGLTVTNRALSGTKEQKSRVYQEVLDAIARDQTLADLVTRQYIAKLIDERVESRMATSVDAASSNPAASGLPERSGSTSLAALTTTISSLVGADKSAVSLNLNALAFATMKDPEIYSALASYQRNDRVRRLSGTLVFGAKIPEKEITGLSNLPDFDKLFDAFSWDVKVRVAGDRDPRSRRWNDMTVGRGGLRTQSAAVLLTAVSATAIEDLQIVQALLEARSRRELSDLNRAIGRSPQLSFKAAGTHLTRERGRNRYSFTALFDVGLGGSDITANAQYAVTDDVRLGTARLFQVKVWTVNAQVTSHLAPDALVVGRTVDWSIGASGSFFQDRRSLPLPVEHTWKLFTSFDFPVRGGGRIPLSVIYASDPNGLTKERFVTGQVGISYDFSTIKQLFGGVGS
jgi:hypothetical protein